MRSAKSCKKEAIMVRRLKSELPKDDFGQDRFPKRALEALEVDYPAEEKRIHAALKRYSELRQLNTRDNAERFATDEATHEALDAAGLLFREPSPEERSLLKEMKSWAERATSQLDAKTKGLARWLNEHIRPAGKWSDERVIIFTEYRATQNWLQGVFAAEGLTGNDRLMTMYGGMDSKDRERIKAAFQTDPRQSPVRILLATDAASEGIDLQNHCSRMIHFEIPWNPNRLEQRNGRIDRHGQKSTLVRIYHFVGKGYNDRERGLVETAEGLLDKLHETKRELRLDPENVRKVVEVALELAGQPLPEPAKVSGLWPDPKRQACPVFRLPVLSGSWEQCAEGFAHPFTGEARPFVFDHALSKGREDVVLVHLNHRLVQMSLRLLRAEVWSIEGRKRMNRVTARVVPDLALLRVRIPRRPDDAERRGRHSHGGPWERVDPGSLALCRVVVKV